MNRLQKLKFQLEEQGGNQDDTLLHFRNKVFLLQYLSTMIQIKEEETEIIQDLSRFNFSDYFTQYLQIAQIKIIKNEFLPDIKHLSGRNGWFQLVLPFSTDKSLQYRFASLEVQSIRIGKFLELLDYCAGISVFRSLRQFTEAQQSIVTASLDNVQFFHGYVPNDQDMYIHCYPSWAHKTSIEIRIDVECVDKNQVKTLYCSAYFLMVLKNFNEKQNIQLPEFSFEGENNIERAKIRYEQGKVRQYTRLSKKDDMEYKKPPTQEENLKLHELFLNIEKFKKSKEFILTRDSTVTNTCFIQMQDKNIYNKVFGGVVLREAYDLAFVAVYKYSNGASPRIYHIDDVHFIAGASVGTIIKYEAKITYVNKYLVHVRVDVNQQIPDKNKENSFVEKKTTEVHLTMICEKLQKPVLPISYIDALDYLEGKRRVDYVSKRYQ